MVRLGSLGAAVVLALGYEAIGSRHYGAYRVPQGYGMYHMLPEELAHTALFLFVGLGLGAAVFAALHDFRGLDALVDAGRRAAHRPWRAAACVALLVAVSCFGIARLVLGHAVITDDEHAYRFVAQTIRTGSLTAPSPGGDLEFFREQFVVLTEHVRYGKYPLGHPLVLALGQALGAEELVVPLMTGLLALPLMWIGSQVFGSRVSVLGLLLFAASPQVLATGATYLSQPTSGLAVLVGLGALLCARRASRPAPWLAVSGLAFGYGILVRPLPGVLFAAVAGVWLGLRALESKPPRRALLELLAFGVPLALTAGVLLVVNRWQSGGVLMTGYQAFHTPGEGAASLGKSMAGDGVSRFMSLVSALLRLDVWLLGWPVSLLPLFLARRRSEAGLLWATVGAALAYRLMAPKAGVGAAGPLYLFEVVPLLCLLAADGLVHLRSSAWLPAGMRHSRVVAALVASGALVCLALFLPPKLGDLGRMGRAQGLLPQVLARQGVHNALVFHQGVAPPELGLTWAYFPPCNPPGLDPDVLYVRLAPSWAANMSFRDRRYPGRSAWFFGYVEGRPTLVPLEALVMGPPGRSPDALAAERP